MPKNKLNNYVPWLPQRTIPTERPALVGEVSTLADGRSHVVRVTDPYGCILDLLDRCRYFFLQVAPQL
jgi:hypothetical protein